MPNPVNVVPVMTNKEPPLDLDIVNVVVEAEAVITKYTVSGMTPQNVGSEKTTASPAAMFVMLSQVKVLGVVQVVTLH